MKILFAFPTNRQELLREVHQGVSPDNLLYGFNHIKGNQMVLGDINQHAERVLDLLFYPLNRLFFKQIDIDFKLGRALLLINQIKKADVLVSNIDGTSLAICFLKKLKIIKTPTIYAIGLYYIQGNLDKTIKSQKNSLFLKFYKWILSASDALIYHADIEKQKLEGLGLFDPAKVSYIPIGSDDAYFKKDTKQKHKNNLIVSIGKDRARDYKTLLKAASQLKDLQFVLVCRDSNVANLEIPKNVKLEMDVPYKEIRNLYQRAKMLVIPMKEMNRSSGQMTLTDGMQAGLPIIITNVVGIKHYNLKNRIDAMLVPLQNADSLKNAIFSLSSDTILRNRLIKNIKSKAHVYTTKNYAKQLDRVISWTTDEFKLTPITSEHLEYLREMRNSNNQYFLTNLNISQLDQKNWYKNYRHKNKSGLEYMYILTSNGNYLGTGAAYDINHNKKEAEIGRFIIDSNYRGHGYGGVLLEKILEVTTRLGLTKITLEVLAQNTKAIKLYKSKGFKIVKSYIKNGKKIIVMKLYKD